MRAQLGRGRDAGGAHLDDDSDEEGDASSVASPTFVTLTKDAIVRANADAIMTLSCMHMQCCGSPSRGHTCGIVDSSCRRGVHVGVTF